MPDPSRTVLIEDRNGLVAVLLAGDGDHIVVAWRTSRRGEEYEAPVAWDTPTWDRAVRRAERVVALAGPPHG